MDRKIGKNRYCQTDQAEIKMSKGNGNIYDFKIIPSLSKSIDVIKFKQLTKIQHNQAAPLRNLILKFRNLKLNVRNRLKSFKYLE